MDGVGNAKGFRIVGWVNGEGPDAAGGETACAKARRAESGCKEWKTPHAFAPAFILFSLGQALAPQSRNFKSHLIVPMSLFSLPLAMNT